MKVAIEMTAPGYVRSQGASTSDTGGLRGKYSHTSEGDSGLIKIRILSLGLIAT